MKVCVVGSGGREHALAEALARTAEVVVAPGNPGIPGSVATPPEQVDADLFVVGPEVPLVEGLADRLRAQGALVFGPGAEGARLEGSKAWMKHVLADAGVPTAAHGTFGADEVDAAVEFLRTLPGLYVVKTDGLAAGKGVLVTESLADAVDDVRAKLSGSAFGDAGRRVVIEEGLSGPEISLLCLADGQRVAPLASAQDFKRVGDGDQGPNTGGMGAYSPVPAVPAAEGERLAEALVLPTLRALAVHGIDYRGVLYAGLMLTPTGPKVLEYNVRFGDPETQVVLPRWQGDVAEVLRQCAAGSLQTQPVFGADAAVTVVCAVEGYPSSPRTGDVIEGLEQARSVSGAHVYCAGVAADDQGRLRTAGGRVFAVTGVAGSLAGARAVAYEAAGQLSWPGITRRSDIALAASV
ncbi:MAG TPA: phosphoribosylamine--glycine ligase [Acidimicrobiales bacterium]